MSELRVAPGALLPTYNALVTVMPEVGTIHVAGPNGSPLQPSIERSAKEIAQHAGALTSMYVAVGPGEHSLRHVSRHTELAGFGAASEAIRLSSILPPDVMSYCLSGDGREVVRFDRVAIVGRRPTEDETEQFAARPNIPLPPLAERRHQEIIDLDPYKIDLSGHDHVSIRLGGRFLHLQLDSPLTLLASRLLGKLSHLPESELRDQIDAKELANHIWDCMPLAERALFTDKDKDLYGAGGFMGKQVNELLNTLTSMLGVTRRGQISTLYRVQTSDMALRYALAPHIGRFAPGTGILYPPGANPDLILGEVPDERVEKARDLLTLLGDGRSVDHDGAVKILDVIVDRDGKRGLGVCLVQSGSDETLTQLIERLDDMARRSLGSSYYIARRDRTPLNRAAYSAAMRKAPTAKAVQATSKWRIIEV